MSVAVPIKKHDKKAADPAKIPEEGKLPEPVLAESPAKLFFIDNLKVFLTILVILHHTAITYGADGGWFYNEVKHTVLPDSVILTMFAACNQSFFMGLFFFLSGCFVVSSLARKTAAQFARDRLVRLGVPVLLFIFVLYPLTIWVGYYPFTLASFMDDMPRLLADISGSHTGPAWFVEVLLIVNLLALAIKAPLIKLAQKNLQLTTLRCLYIGLGIGACSFLVRLVFPDGYTVMNIQLSYLPQYFFYFFAGAVIGTRGILRLAQTQKIIPWLAPAVLLLAGLTLALSILLDTAPFVGGLNPYSLYYSFAQGFLSVALSIICLVSFYRVANPSAWWDGSLGQAAYGAFFIHAPVLVAMAILMQPFSAAPMIKFLLLGALSIPASFALGFMLANLPLLKRVFGQANR